jgi:hypothetical protein
LGSPIDINDFFTPESGLIIRLTRWGMPYSWQEKNAYDSSMNFANALFDNAYGIDSRRKKTPHVPYLIDQEIMGALENKFSEHFERTSSSRFRQPTDMQLGFTYSYYLISEKRWKYAVETSGEDWEFVSVSGEWRNLKDQLMNLINFPKKFICLNDDINFKNTVNSIMLRRTMENFYLRLFPDKSSFEL